MLGIVQDDQGGALAQQGGEGRERRLLGGRSRTNDLGDRPRHQRPIEEGGQAHPPDAIGEIRVQHLRHPQRQPRLAAPPGTGQGHQAGIPADQRDRRGDFGGAPDQPGQRRREGLGRQRARRRGGCLRRWCSGWEVAAEDRGVEILGLRVGGDIEIVAQARVQQLILPHRQLAATLPGIEAHQADVGLLVRRLVREDPLPHRFGGAFLTGLLVKGGEFAPERQRQPVQALGEGQRPIGVAIVRQERPAIARQRGDIVVARAGAPRDARGALESDPVDRTAIGRGQRDHSPPHQQRFGQGERPPRQVTGLPEGGVERTGILLGPQHVEHLLAAQALLRGQREQLDELQRLARTPGTFGDDALTAGDGESPQHGDGQHRRGRHTPFSPMHPPTVS